MSRADVNPAVAFLRTPTPDAWLALVPNHLPELLIDHANCEKKAASNALSLMYKYVDQPRLLRLMSRLAREELRHFEQVLDLMAEQGIDYRHLTPAPYAQGLHRLVRKTEPQRLVDLLIVGAVVEARSCERFVRLIEVLPAAVSQLYRQLVHSEARHFEDYLSLARTCSAAADDDVDARVEVFLAEDARLINAQDACFRFHSGVPG
ncbi:MAG: tRNA-(ms[2]io[6]A)-hydroxylase [Pseudomonadota bacterium]